MSAQVKGVVEVELRHDRFTNPAKQVGRELDTMGNKGKAAMTTLSTTSRMATGDLRALGTAGTSSFNQIGAGAAAAGLHVKKTAAEINAARTATLGMAGSVAGLAASFVGLETSITNIPKRLKAIDQAEVALARAQDLVDNKTLALQRTQFKLNKARESGKKTAEEINLLEQKITNTRQQLTTATDDLSVKIQDLDLKNADYADTIKLFATSVATTFLTAFTSVSIILTQAATQANLTTGAFLKLRLSALASSRAFRLLVPSIASARFQVRLAAFNFVEAGRSIRYASISTQGFTVALRSTRLALLGVKAGIKAVFAALGPVGWAILGLTTAYELLANNVLGVRDALVDLFEWLHNIIPIFRGVAELIRTVFPTAEEEMQKMNDAAGDAAISIGDLGDEIDDTGGALMEFVETAVPGVDGAVSKFEELRMSFVRMNELIAGEGVQEIESYTSALLYYLGQAVEGADTTSAGFRMAMSEISDEVVSTGRDIYDHLGPDRFAEYEKAVNRYTDTFVDDLKKIRTGVKATAGDLDDLKKNFNNLVRDGVYERGADGKLRPSSKIIMGFYGPTVNGLQSRLTIDQFLKSSLAPQKVDGLSLTSDFRSLASRAGVNIGGTAGAAISNALAYSASITNTVGPSFTTGYRTNRSRIKQQNRERFAAMRRAGYSNAINRLRTLYGLDPIPNVGLARAGSKRRRYILPDRYNRPIAAPGAAADQLSEFFIPLDYSERSLSTRVGRTATTRGFRRYLSNRLAPGQFLQGEGRRVNDPRYYYGIFEYQYRQPTFYEAVEAAFAESRRVEDIYNEINATNRRVGATIAGLREADAREKLEAERERIRELARDLTGDAVAKDAVIENVKGWLATDEGEYHVHNVVKYNQREREALAAVAI